MADPIDPRRALMAQGVSTGLMNLGSQLLALGTRGRVGGQMVQPPNVMDIYRMQAEQQAAADEQARRDAFASYINPTAPEDVNRGGTGQSPMSLMAEPQRPFPNLGQDERGLVARLGVDHPLSQSMLMASMKPAEVVPQYGPPQFDAKVGKFYQVNPKTGKREYISQPTGMDITLPDGTVIGTGVPRAGQGVPGMSKTTGTKVEGEILKYGDIMSGLRAIRSRYRPEFQQLGTRWDTLQTAWKDKMGMDVDPADKALLADYTAYVAEAGQNFSETLKNLSGVAVNPEEMKRAERFAVNPGTPGLWGIITGDGDSPTQLEAKLQRQEEFVQRAMMKYQYLQYNGFGVEDVDLDDMPRLMNEKGDELFAEYSKTMPEADAMAKTKADLAAEFGIGIF